MDEKQEQKFHQLTEEPVGRLISQLAVPCIISMLVTAFYNMADTFFVGMLRSNAATGAVGVVRRDPMAMLPFCGYHMGDYFQHWFEMGEKLGENAPKIFNVNWFRLDSEGHFLWPGFGDNFRVLEWILKRCEGKVDAKETAIGYVPYAEDINLEGIQDFDIETLKSILEVDKAAWAKEAEGIEEFYKQFGDKLPQELRNQLETLKKNCAE